MPHSPTNADFTDTGILIVAYRRFKNLEDIFQRCRDAGFERFFFHIDRPSPNNLDAYQDHNQVISTIHKLQSLTKSKFGIKITEQNQGCAVSVISATDWAFSTSIKNLIIFEDDCLPTKAFFDFYKIGIVEVETNPNIWLLCGTQFAPENITHKNLLISRYALTWGWATSHSRWTEIRSLFYKYKNFWWKDLLSVIPESSFWYAGSRRARYGFTDVWDTILLQGMLDSSKFALLPPRSLVSNLGNDSVASHVSKASAWTKTVSERALDCSNSFEVNLKVDDWLRKFFFDIRFRHVFTTKLTLILDLLFLFGSRRKFKSQLSERLADI